jgi:DNA (cytosine-5)-methyltransferase 1
MSRPRLLDLFCGAGGAAMGYHRAGFDVVGVDIAPQPHYPFEFHQADALSVLRSMAYWPSFSGELWRPASYDALHASPVCKRYSVSTPAWARNSHPSQIPETRALLQETGLPWVMENVPGAPLRPDIKLCGCAVGLNEIERERWFETGGWDYFELRPPCYHATSPITVAGHGEPSGPRMAHGLVAHKADWERAMGIGWMNRDELAQAIPPAYTEHVGAQLAAHLTAVTR